MKKILTIAAMAISITMVLAGNHSATIHIRLNNQALMRVVLNGQDAGLGSGTISMNNIPAGRNFLQVYRLRNSFGYRVMENAYRGFIVVSGNSENFITVYPEKRTLVFDEIIALDGCGYGVPHINDYCGADVPRGEFCGPLTPRAPSPMHPASFQLLKQTLANSTFENSRLVILKQALDENYFTTRQVQELMEAFTFESYKLEVAKLAYPKTLDPENYYVVNNGFSFSSSISQLQQHLALR